MKRVEENLGSITNSKARSMHNSVMELQNMCNHPYLSQLHVEEVDNLIPKHYLPSIIRLSGKLEMLDRLFPKLKATNIRLLDVMVEYLSFKQYWYLRLDGHTSSGDHGSLIDIFSKPDSPFFSYFFSGLEEHSFTGSLRLLLKIHCLSLWSFDSIEVFQHVFW